MLRTEQSRMETRAAKMALLSLGWTHRELAKRTGLSKSAVDQVLCGHYPSWPAKAAVNAALGREIFKRQQGPTSEAGQQTGESQTTPKG